MAGCILRASGESFNVDKFLRGSSFNSCKIFRKGEAKAPGVKFSNSKFRKSGMNIVVSNQETLQGQIEDALNFLRQHADELKRLRAFNGVESVDLDFGLWCSKAIAQFYRFPAELVVLLGQLGLGLEVSHYTTEHETARPDF